MNKLVCCYIGQDVEQFVQMSLDSINAVADKVVFVDGGSKDKTIELLNKYTNNISFSYKVQNEVMTKEKLENNKFFYIHRPYDQNDKEDNGKARNCYLKY